MTVYPPPSPNSAVITQGSSTYSYNPTGGNTNGQTVTTLPSYTDPGARFVMTNLLIQRSDFAVRVYYRSIPGWSWVWTSNMIVRKGRSCLWMLAPLVMVPLVLVLWCLPPKRALTTPA